MSSKSILFVNLIFSIILIIDGLPLYIDSPEHIVSIQSGETARNIPHPPSAFTSYRGNNKDLHESDSPISIINQGPPKMLGNVRGAVLHVAPGAYPVYYGIARANGKFGKYIRALTPAEIESYNIV